MRTVLFAIELFDVVASFVVLTEVVLVLLFVKDGVFVPGRSGLGARGMDLALQNVDCTRNNEGNVRNRSRSDAPQGAS